MMNELNKRASLLIEQLEVMTLSFLAWIFEARKFAKNQQQLWCAQSWEWANEGQ